MNALEEHNALVDEQTRRTIAAVRQGRAEKGWVPSGDYLLAGLAREVREAVRKEIGGEVSDVQLSFIDRARFQADVCVTIPQLLQSMGNKQYIADIAPRLAKVVRESTPAIDGRIQAVDQKGFYVNLRLSDRYLLGALERVFQLRASYGECDQLKGQGVLVDYSSPNAAKTLHAGHIRSTIIGEVLANIAQACGAAVYRLNHINDLGGFGFLLEGFRRWKEKLPANATQNEKLSFLYLIRRGLEKIAEEQQGAAKPLSARERETLKEYFGECATDADYLARFHEYVTASDARFEKLENGDREEVALWAEMVRWSLDDFKTFYDLLGVHHDFAIGESFYPARGMAVLQRALESGRAVKFSEELCAKELDALAREKAQGRVSDEIYNRLCDAARKDVGALVVQLDNHERMIVLRRDGRTIYATRDIGAIEYRLTVFEASRALYVIGQEQREHFVKLFDAAVRLGIVPAHAKLEFVGFGFYVDPKTKQKLSSRDGAANVNRLIESAIAYFQQKYESLGQFDEAARREIARQLAVGSIIFNDLRRDRKGNVEIPTDIAKAAAEFENSGGAYVVYAACRARGILRKYGKELPALAALKEFALNDSEVTLLKRVLEFPVRVADAERNLSPVPLLTHLFDTARAFNSYYSEYPVIKGGEVHEHRLLLCAAVAQMLQNGLRLCNIACPEKL